MQLYLYILKLFLLKKELWLRYKDVVDREFLRNNYPELLRLFNALDRLHENHQGVCGIADLGASFLVAYPASSLDAAEPLLKEVEASVPNEASIEEYLSSLEQRVRASKLAFTALDVAEGKAGYEALEKVLSEFRQNPDAGEISAEKFVTDDLDQLYDAAVGKGGLKWRLTSLNRSLGPLRKGDFGFIFARPETGKTTFLASEVTFMASQAESSVLWINNEEQGEKVLLRCYEAALGAPLEQIIANRERAKAAFFERTGRRIRLLDNAGVTRRDVERLCEIHNPSLIIVDQLDKVNGFDGDREDLRMGAIYQWARELAKQYAPVIGVSQSDGSGEGVKYLNMGNVANAKTAKQAEADWILGIGFSYDDHPNVRGISICKNKLIGGEESVSKMRHGKFDVLIEPEIARYRDMQKD
jgi:replicative DNA helicase